MSRFIIELAKQTDNAALQKALFDNPMDGQIQMVFQRQPDFFQASMIGNKLSQTVVAKDIYSGKVVGIGTRSVRALYVNGVVTDVGYLSDLRLGSRYRKGTLVARGYRYLRQLHNDRKVDIYLTTITDDNRQAIETLTSRRAGLPVYHYYGMYCSYAVNLIRKKKPLRLGSISIVRGSHELIDDIVDCLNRNGAQKQFSPFYCKEDFVLNRSIIRGFRVEDFFVAVKDNKVLGVLGKWDQSNLKQIIILGYKGRMRILKPIFNFGARIMEFLPLPDEGKKLNSFFISFIAIDNNNLDIFRLLLRAVYNSSVGGRYSFFIVGLHSGDRLVEALPEYNCIRYNTRLYVVYWQDAEEVFSGLDGRIPYLEVATL